MAVIRPFECVRPQAEKAERVAALPYDVYNREEACREVAREPLSFLKIDRNIVSIRYNVLNLPDTIQSCSGGGN